ncbi:ATP-binding protein [Kordiimonas pumila]|uniref:ATP-binding protein n=1 Tax=Kordiimonas pumila TaxID=2161677 RepID=A0ABV7D1D3_9PROT|nr:ATP-binding protein [Kordiimonas pumila]
MTSSQKPYAMIYAPDKTSTLYQQLKELESSEYRLVTTAAVEDLGAVGLEKYHSISAYIIDVMALDMPLKDIIAHISPSYIEERGVVILVGTSARLQMEKPCHTKNLKYVVLEDDPRPLRVAISVEVEEFERIQGLKKAISQYKSVVGQVTSGEFKLKTRKEAQHLSTILSMSCPDPVPVAIGLSELLINGVEHGCLGISHDEKGTFIEAGTLNAEIERRRKLPENADKFVVVSYERKPDKVTFIIKDSGQGFDFKSYLDSAKGHNRKHGRGITMAKGCFDYLEYRGSGNEVFVVHVFQKEL